MSTISRSARIELWRERMERFERSNMTVAAFCQQEQFSVPSFYNWKRRLSESCESQNCPTQPNEQPAPAHQQLGVPSGGHVSQGSGGPFEELLVRSGEPSLPAHASLPGGVTISLGNDPLIVSVIVDRLLQHAHCTSLGAGSC